MDNNFILYTFKNIPERLKWSKFVPSTLNPYSDSYSIYRMYEGYSLCLMNDHHIYFNVVLGSFFNDISTFMGY